VKDLAGELKYHPQIPAKTINYIALEGTFFLAHPVAAVYIKLCDDFPIFEPAVKALRRARCFRLTIRDVD